MLKLLKKVNYKDIKSRKIKKRMMKKLMSLIKI